MVDTLDDLNDDYLLALPMDTLLHEYRIEGILGQGGFGITYLARDILLDEKVAIKEFFPSDNAVRTRDLTARPKSPHDKESFRTGLETFLGEARIIARFRHPNIMQVRRFFEMHGTGYIVMQFESGQSLEDVVKDGALPEADVVPILAGLLDGLDIVHAQAILHRDIKPRNVIIREDGTPVLIDFGAARDFTQRNSQTVTKMASPGYSPPEQYGVGSQQGPWSDFYALGAMMYRVVTGKLPADSLRRLRNDPLVPAAKLAGSKYSKALLATIDHMMRIEESERPASVADIREALASVSPVFARPDRDTRRVGAKPQIAPAPKQASVRRVPSRKVIGLGAGVAAALLAGVAFFVMRGGNTGTAQHATTQTSPDQADRGGETLKPAETAKPVGTDPSAGSRDARTTPAADPLKSGRFLRDCPTCPELAVLPAGRFDMGSEDGFLNETPVHGVVIAASFAMSRRPVTFDDWDACVAGGGCDYRPADQGWGRGARPVVNVNWADANAYIAWLSQKSGKRYRLPTEAEWEYAARAGTTSPYWWGGEADAAHAICSDCQVPHPTQTQPTASFPANGFGLFDMAGNAAEWIEDCWTESYAGAPSDGAPIKGTDCPQRGLRGGSFRTDARYLRTAARSHFGAALRVSDIGFRVVRDGDDQ